MTLAYSYIRWSSDKQSLGDSERRQTEAATRYAQEHGLTMSTMSIRDSGVSAYRGKNAAEGALARFLDAVDAGEIERGSFLLIEHLDRLSRSPVMTALALFQSIVARGITIVTINDGQVYSTSTVDANWTLLIIALANMSKAHSESADKGRRVKEAWDAKRAAGGILTSVCPAWLTVKGQKFVVDQARAATVRRIFEMSELGVGTPTIARRLNEDNTPTFGRANQWTNGLVAHVLHNKSVIGVFTPKKADADEVEGYYPPIIDRSLYYKVQAKFKDREWSVGNPGLNIANLFSGACFCSCGAKLRIVSSSKPNVYLRCVRAYSNSGCDKPRIPYRAVETEILASLLLDQDDDVLMLAPKGPDPIVALKAELEAKNKQQERLLDAIMDGTIGKEQASARASKIKSEIEGLRMKIAKAIPRSQQVDSISLAFQLYEQHEQALFGAGDLYTIRQHLQAILRRIVKRVTLDGSTRIELTLDGRDEGDPFVCYWKPLPQGFQPGNVNGLKV